jgi:Putative transposase
VLAYLSRYTHRVAISNRRLERGVTFRYKDYRADGLARHKVMTLATEEFIRRFMLHILPKGFHRIRHYGLFAATGRAANIARLRELLDATPPAENAASPAQDLPAETVLPPCPRCGGCMTIIEFFERGTLPRYRPPSAAVIWFDTS